MASIAVEGFKNNINNYKGVMLCTRPNENIGLVKDKPFVSRVDPKESLGINPVKKGQVVQSRKKVNPILAKHRAWLTDFQVKMREKRQTEDQKDVVDKARNERIRELAMVNRVKSGEGLEEINEINVTSPKVAKVQPKQDNSQEASSSPPAKKPETKKKKLKGKPKWAYTEEQVKDEEEMEVDDLLDFTNNLDYEKYINDVEVKNMVAALKTRINELNKNDDDWKKNIVDAWNDDRKSVQLNKVDIGDDRSDVRSMCSEGKSVASERSTKSIVELKQKLENKEKKDWESMSTTTKKQQASIEERIAKHVADEILRNNTQFRHFHSNASVRRILEKEAQKQIEENKGIRGPNIVANQEYFSRKDVTDPNNLPYLHRNPAI